MSTPSQAGEPASGKAALPRFRSCPEDFQVDEIPAWFADEAGHHWALRIEKTLRNTQDVADDLARLLRCPPAQIGFAGRKDRVAVTRQWFSIPRSAGLEPLELAGTDWRVLEAVPTRQKLHLGDLQGNRFELLVRGAAEDREVLQRLEALARRGCPNTFGDQRFGRRGDNAANGAAVLRGEPVAGGRKLHRFFVSALQAKVFNEIVARRPAALDELLPGDLAMVHSSGRLIPVLDPKDHQAALERFEVSATAPLFGPKVQAAKGAVGQLETQVLEEQSVGDLDRLRPPRGLRIDGERRPIRIPVLAAAAEPEEEGWRLRFTLPPGAYATTLLHSLFPQGLVEGDREEGRES